MNSGELAATSQGWWKDSGEVAVASGEMTACSGAWRGDSVNWRNDCLQWHFSVTIWWSGEMADNHNGLLTHTQS